MKKKVIELLPKIMAGFILASVVIVMLSISLIISMMAIKGLIEMGRLLSWN